MIKVDRVALRNALGGVTGAMLTLTEALMSPVEYTTDTIDLHFAALDSEVDRLREIVCVDIPE